MSISDVSTKSSVFCCFNQASPSGKKPTEKVSSLFCCFQQEHMSKENTQNSVVNQPVVTNKMARDSDAESVAITVYEDAQEDLSEQSVSSIDLEIQDVGSEHLSDKASVASGNSEYFDAIDGEEDLSETSKIVAKKQLSNHLAMFLGEEMAEFFMRFFKEEVQSFEIDGSGHFTIGLNDNIEDSLKSPNSLLNGAHLSIPKTVQGTLSTDQISFDHGSGITFDKTIMYMHKKVSLNKVSIKDSNVLVDSSFREKPIAIECGKFFKLFSLPV